MSPLSGADARFDRETPRDSQLGAVSGIHEALAVLAAGGMVVVADGRDREDEGDLVMAAAAMTTEQMAFFLRWGSGIVCTPMSVQRAAELELPQMVEDNTDNHATAFTVTVDSVAVGTGISAVDRARTVRALADATTRPGGLRRPGHVFPLVSRPGGVLKRAGHTEASTDLLELAGATGVAVITELVGDDGVPLGGDGPAAFAREYDLPYVRIDDIVRYRRESANLVERTGTAQLPLDHGAFRATAYTSVLDGVEHLALIHGDIARADASEPGVLVRVHSECLTGDIFGSRRCDCGGQLDEAMKLIVAEGAGVIVYLRGHEGRGIGIGHKLRAYALQEAGHDTVDANIALGLPVDSREYGVGAAILADLGVHRLRLITNSPEKFGGLDGYGLELAGRVRTHPSVNVSNIAYLRTKRDRMGHDIDLPPLVGQA